MRDILMNSKERERERVFCSVKKREISQVKAAQLLGLSYSHTKRLWAQFKKEGPKGLISRKRGKKSNRAISDQTKSEIIEIIAKNYYGCKPLYISEVLSEHHGYHYSSEFIRKLMIENNLWISKKRPLNLHQRRPRKECKGELIQIDASIHDWFEGRLLKNGELIKPFLHIVIDDASSFIYSAYFDYEETTEAYFRTVKKYFEEVGLPKALYSDRRSSFISSHGDKRNKTQFGLAMEELGVKMIFAYSPEAKGRVERAFGTLQERLVWEMRRQNITTLEEANEFLPKYIEYHNSKFSVKPASNFDAHRSLDHNEKLKYILCKREKRSLRKNLEVFYNNKVYQLEFPKEMAKPTRKTSIEVLTTLEGELFFRYRGKLLEYKIFEDQIFDKRKRKIKINKVKKTTYKPPKNHPWRRPFISPIRQAASFLAAFISSFC